MQDKPYKMQTSKVVGQIFDKKIDEKDLWTRYSFIIKTNNGRTMALGLFIKDNEKENERLRKEALIKDFKKGDTAEFEFYDKKSGTTTYHNITNIKEIVKEEEPKLAFDELKTANEEYNIVTLDKNIDLRAETREMAIFRSECFNNACVLLNGKIAKGEGIIPNMVFKLAKTLFDEGKKQKFLEWR